MTKLTQKDFKIRADHDGNLIGIVRGVDVKISAVGDLSTDEGRFIFYDPEDGTPYYMACENGAIIIREMIEGAA
jgi:hypothetical protein